jgi:hypothetical protein
MEIRVADAAGGPVAAAELAGGEDVAVDGDGVWVAERWPTGRSRLRGGKQVDQPCPLCVPADSAAVRGTVA